MNRKVIVIAGLGVLVLTLAFTAVAFAQTPTPPPPPDGYGSGYGYGPGMMGGWGYGRGMMGGYARGEWGGPGVYGPMHEAMFDALAKGLGISRAELDERVAAGETPAQVAAAKGIDAQGFYQIMTEARTTAIEQAVADGTLTQAQADWMLSRMAGRGYGYGHCPYYDGAPNR